MKTSRVIQKDLIKETTIVNGTRTETTRALTDKEKIKNLEAILNFGQ